MNLLIATHNKDKLKEIKNLLSSMNITILSLNEIKNLPEVIEDRETIEGNAIKKAVETAEKTKYLTLADDTGFFIDALDGAPGVFAARFAGDQCSYKDNRDKALKELEGKENRRAHFRTVIAFASPAGLIKTESGEVFGTITHKEVGTKGFGYDSIFRADESGKTFAEMGSNEKHEISHRGRALKKIIPFIVDYFKKLEV